MPQLYSNLSGKSKVLLPDGSEGNQDGVMEGSQHNTMDVNYFGPNPQMGFSIRDLARLYERMVMRKHTNGGYVHVLDELWKVCEQFNANFIIMYQHVCCKTMAGLQGLFD